MATFGLVDLSMGWNWWCPTLARRRLGGPRFLCSSLIRGNSCTEPSIVLTCQLHNDASVDSEGDRQLFPAAWAEMLGWDLAVYEGRSGGA